MSFSTVELCAGGGGQALGLEMAGFHQEALVEYEPHFCTTLRRNRPHWNTCQEDIRSFPGEKYTGTDLLAGGVPCSPFTIAGKQLGADDDRDMFPAALALVEKMKPRAVLLENVPGLASRKFGSYRRDLLAKLSKLGYQPEWRVLQASGYGVPQLRPRFILVALRPRTTTQRRRNARRSNGRKRLARSRGVGKARHRHRPNDCRRLKKTWGS